MSWEDFVTHFWLIDVCRVRHGWAEMRMHTSLPAQVVAPSATIRAFEISVAETCQAEFTLMQPTKRGDALVSLRDLLLLLLRRPDDRSGGGGTRMQLLSCSDRSSSGAVNCEALVASGRYLLIPLSLGGVGAREGKAAQAKQTVCRLGSAKPLFCDSVDLPALEVAAAIGTYARRGERRDAFDGMSVYTLQDAHGVLTFAENLSASASRLAFHVRLDHSGSRGVSPSRGDLRSSDVIAPLHGQLLQVLNRESDASGYEMRCAMEYGAQPHMIESHHPDAAGCYMHASVAVPVDK